ncbi:MAG: hypothetical protein QOJ07_331, partial [Thermoleophilaceae bacterium]|nr:hypothetical protein [Thermoleophilaceae bacterium]
EAGERIADALERPFHIHESEIHNGASIGAALFPDHAEDTESLLKRADSAMYQAKAAGGGTVAIYREAANDSRRRLSLTSQLRRAISEGELRVHYQPIFRVSDLALTSLEALVRWQHPEQGLVPPGVFIPVAEQTGLIDPITEYVIDAVCGQAREWLGQGRRPTMTFNLAPRQTRRADLAESVLGQITGHRLDPSQFCVELTETSVLSDERRHRSLLTEFSEAGLAVAIDDFGAGHSSLARLRDMPVHVLKVDRSFLARVPADPRSSAIVAAILELSAALGMTTVVEGVEEQSQLDFLSAHACPLVQGFLLGRPVPADQIDAELLPAAPTAVGRAA